MTGPGRPQAGLGSEAHLKRQVRFYSLPRTGSRTWVSRDTRLPCCVTLNTTKATWFTSKGINLELLLRKILLWSRIGLLLVPVVQ